MGLGRVGRGFRRRGGGFGCSLERRTFGLGAGRVLLDGCCVGEGGVGYFVQAVLELG